MPPTKKIKNKNNRTMRIKLCGYLACALMLAAGLVSCQQEEDRPHGVQYPIVFSNSSETRATATEDDLMKDGFTVYAFVQGNAGSTSFAKDVVYNATYEVWAFESPEYWIPNTDYYFKAFYPKALTSDTLKVDTSKSDLDFTISDFDITSQTDLLVAEAQAVVNPGEAAPTSGNIVKLNFQHLLANVVVKVKSEISNVSVGSVSFSNIANKGDFDGESWTHNEQTSLSKLKSIALVKDADFVDITDGGFLVIPQVITPNAHKVNVETTHKQYSDIGIPNIKWESGKQYTYTLIIKQENIIFDQLSVEEWDEENATGSVIIK